ncbi:MAG: MarR family transcriptional regulator [Coriobacteriales bacterium]|jgi:DNA-binding MarR family transcriptional regulator
MDAAPVPPGRLTPSAKAGSAGAPVNLGQDAPGKTGAQGDDYRIDSAFLLAFEMAHDAFKLGVKGASDLNVTLYRTLLGLLRAPLEGIAQVELGRALDMRPNALTQSLNALEERGLTRRVDAAGDGRVRMAQVTQEGIDLVQRVNDAVAEQLYRIFPTDNETYRAALEALIESAPTQPVSTAGTTLRYRSSYTLAVVERFLLHLGFALSETCDLDLTQARVLQRLLEEGEPMRVGEIGRQLRVDAPRMSRVSRALAGRELVARLASPSNRRTVYLGLTDEGLTAAQTVADVIDDAGRDFFWSRLSPKQSRATASVGRVMINDFRRQEAQRRRSELEALVPIDER